MRLLFFALFMALATSVEAQQPATQSQPEATSNQAETATAGERNAAPKQQSTLDLPLAIQGIESAIRDLIAEEDKVAREEERNRDKADLRAQESMAVWAFWMFVASTASVVLTAVGVVLIWRTLHHTKVAADHTQAMLVEAEKTTKAANDAVLEAKETNRIAQENAVVERRPWLDLRFVGRRPPIETKSGTVQTSHQVLAVNVGNTPALNIKTAQDQVPFDMEVMKTGHQARLDKVEAAALEAQHSRTILFPGQSIMAAGFTGPEPRGGQAVYVAVAYQILGADQWVVSSGVFITIHYVNPGESAQVMDGEPHVGPITLGLREGGRAT